MRIILASNSPRRKELMSLMAYEYSVVSIDCDESFPDEMSYKEVASFLAKEKSKAYPNLQKDELLITADTIVEFQGEILGKPVDLEDAQRMLSKLSGNTHRVFTAICLRSVEKTVCISDTAEVTFSPINKEEIDYYLDTYHPMDKAGSYGIQDWLGLTKITQIKGSYYTIMGLPTHILYEEILKFCKK